jgi:solute carrier family 39 (zinc transporter), member 9
MASVGSDAIAVIILSSVMFIASLGAGTVPLLISRNCERMNIISSLSVGLLVGTSLGVVLPEGTEMLYTSKASAPPVTQHQLLRKAENTVSEVGVNQLPGVSSYHLTIALALVSGYLIMHLLTFLPPLLLTRNPRTPIPLASLPSSPRLERPLMIPDPPTGLSNTTIGLCIHALADGIALGSSAVSNNIALEGIVFFAIMLHKVILFNVKSLRFQGTSFIFANCDTPSQVIPSSFDKKTTPPVCSIISIINRHHIFCIIRYFT